MQDPARLSPVWQKGFQGFERLRTRVRRDLQKKATLIWVLSVTDYSAVQKQAEAGSTLALSDMDGLKQIRC